MNALAIPWRGVFPVLAAAKGYEGSELAVSEMLGAGSAPAGWPKDDVPTLVLVSNPVDPDQAGAVRRLESDERFRIASHLFNCFRLDARSFRSPPSETELSVFSAEGKLIGRVTTQKLLDVLDHLETAWRTHTGRDLSRSLPELDTLITGLGVCETRVALLEKEILCDRCPKHHEDAAIDLAKSVVMRRAYRTALERWRSKGEPRRVG